MSTDKIIIYAGIAILTIIGFGTWASIAAFLPDFLGYEATFHMRASAYWEWDSRGDYEWTKFGSHQAFREARWNGILTFVLGAAIATPFLFGASMVWTGHRRSEWMAKTWEMRSPTKPKPQCQHGTEFLEKTILRRKIARVSGAGLCALIGVAALIAPAIVFSNFAKADDGGASIIVMGLTGGTSIVISAPFFLASFMLYASRNKPRQQTPRWGVFNERTPEFHENEEILEQIIHRLL